MTCQLSSQSWGRGYAELGAGTPCFQAELGALLRRLGGGGHAELGALNPLNLRLTGALQPLHIIELIISYNILFLKILIFHKRDEF
jgi:hypothetical protein